MRAAFSLSALLALSTTAAFAQSPATNGSQANTGARSTLQVQEQAPTADGRPQQRTERLRHEDSGSRIDELRVGGTTRSIAVQPKDSALPAYDVQPQGEHALKSPRSGSDGTAGHRVWNVMKF